MKLGQNGIGLIQVMIAVAGVAGISYTIMNQGEMDRKIKVKANFDQQYEAHAQRGCSADKSAVPSSWQTPA